MIETAREQFPGPVFLSQASQACSTFKHKALFHLQHFGVVMSHSLVDVEPVCATPTCLHASICGAAGLVALLSFCVFGLGLVLTGPVTVALWLRVGELLTTCLD